MNKINPITVKNIVNLISKMKSDSKQESENANNELDSIAKEYFISRYKISKKYNINTFYNYNGGGVSFEFKEKNILYFSLYMTYGEYSNQASVSIEDLSNFDYLTFELECKNNRIKNIEDKLNCLDNEKNRLIIELNDLKNE